MLFSVSYPRARVLVNDDFHFFIRQLIWIAVGTVAAAVVYSINPQRLRRWSAALVFITLLLLILPLIPGMSNEYLGARRWVTVFNVSFQPSELLRFSLVVYLAHILANKQQKLHDSLNALVPPACVVAVAVIIIYLQNDFSTALFFLAIAGVIFFAGGVALRYFLAFGISALPLTLIMLFTREHRVQRLLAFINPDIDPSGIGFQMRTARSALVKGGLWGEGIGQSTQKFGVIPEVHSDFIVAIIAEELGYMGLMLVILLFVNFAFRGYRVALLAKDDFVRLCAMGITNVIFLQVLVNIAVVAGLIPTTGMTLPFFSAGGSSLVVTLTLSGLLLRLSHQEAT